MKTWFVDITVKYTDDLDEDPKKPWDENYVFIFQAQTNTSAIKRAIKLAMKEFKQDFDHDYTINDFIITEIYETSEDARL